MNHIGGGERKTFKDWTDHGDLRPRRTMLMLTPITLGLAALVLMGPDKIPHAAHKASQSIRVFQQFRERMEREIREMVDPATELARMARSPAQILHRLADLPSSTVAEVKRELSLPRLTHGAPGTPIAAVSGSPPTDLAKADPSGTPAMSPPSDHVVTNNPEMN